MSVGQNPGNGSLVPVRPPGIPDASQTAQFMRKVEGKLIFDIEWNTLLSAGPRSIAKMASCFLATHASDPTLSLSPHEELNEIMLVRRVVI